MLKKVLFTAILIIIFLSLAVIGIYFFTGSLFREVPLLMAAATAMGIATGIIRGIRYNVSVRGLIYPPDRHTIDTFLEHWATASGIFILMISGLFFHLHYLRGFSKNLHFLGLIMTLYFGSYFLAHLFVSKKYHYLMPGINDIFKGTIKKYLFKGAWQDTGKYMAAQKAAFLAFSFLGIGIFLTGLVKVAFYYFSLPPQLVRISTTIHDILSLLFAGMVFVHILLVLTVRSYRRLLPSLFTGKLKSK
jgi:cytochrome b subunit of formate dehydrogenase